MSRRWLRIVTAESFRREIDRRGTMGSVAAAETATADFLAGRLRFRTFI